MGQEQTINRQKYIQKKRIKNPNKKKQQKKYIPFQKKHTKIK